MLAARKRQRTQRLLLLGTVVLALYVGLVYRPLSQRANELDGPVREMWKRLAEVSAGSASGGGRQLLRIDAAFEQVQGSLATVNAARAALAARIDPGPELAARLGAPFQLIEFQNERQLAMEELLREARQRKVKFDPALASGFPEYTAEYPQPGLLWAQLSLLQASLSAAIQCEVTGIASVAAPPIETVRHLPGGGETPAEVTLEVELTGPAPAVARFLESLPLRQAELKARGLPAAKADKPAYFIERLFLRKESKDKLDEVRLRVTISSFVPMAERPTPDANRG
jgi:hypothetical protein